MVSSSERLALVGWQGGSLLAAGPAGTTKQDLVSGEDGGVRLSLGWSWRAGSGWASSRRLQGPDRVSGNSRAMNCSGEGGPLTWNRGSPQGPSQLRDKHSQSSGCPGPLHRRAGWLPDPAGQSERVCVCGRQHDPSSTLGSNDSPEEMEPCSHRGPQDGAPHEACVAATG